MKKEKRTNIVKSRFNTAELEILRANADGYPLGSFLRNVGLGNTIKEVFRIKRIYPPADPDLIRELHRIGVNINQIARKVNEETKDTGSLDTFQILMKLEAIQKELEEIKENNKNDSQVF